MHNSDLMYWCPQPPPARYGGRHTVTLIPGDGIGPDLLNHVRELFRSGSSVYSVNTVGIYAELVWLLMASRSLMFLFNPMIKGNKHSFWFINHTVSNLAHGTSFHIMVWTLLVHFNRNSFMQISDKSVIWQQHNSWSNAFTGIFTE